MFSVRNTPEVEAATVPGFAFKILSFPVSRACRRYFCSTIPIPFSDYAAGAGCSNSRRTNAA